MSWLDTLFRFGALKSIAVADSSTPTTVSDTDAAEARVLVLTGTLTAARSVVLSHRAGADWIVLNNTTGGYAVTVKGPTGTGYSVASSKIATVFSDGSKYLGTTADSTPEAALLVGMPRMPDGSRHGGPPGDNTTWRDLVVVGTTTLSADPAYFWTWAPPTVMGGMFGTITVAAKLVAVSPAGASYARDLRATFLLTDDGLLTRVGGSATTPETAGTTAGIDSQLDSFENETVQLYWLGRAAETWAVGATIEIVARTTPA